MKILALFLIMLILSSMTLSTKNLGKKALKEGSTMTAGVEKKTSVKKVNSSSTKAKLNDEENTLSLNADYKPATIVESLISDGKNKVPKVIPEEIRSKNVFYDGSNNIGASNVNCNELSSSPNSCVNSDKCGWCGDKNQCVPGTSRGPLSPCSKNSFIFHANSDKWNPLKAGTININTNGAIQLVAKPDLSNIYVNSSYN